LHVVKGACSSPVIRHRQLVIAATFDSNYCLTSISHQGGGATESAGFANVRFAPILLQKSVEGFREQ